MDHKYEKGGDAGSKGVRFQINLLTLFLLKALCNLKNWRLSTENNKAGKFDDVVLEYPDGAILLQAKHRENKSKITLEDLLSANTKRDDFSLPKYFLSYQEIKSRFKIKNVIVCTNANFDKKISTFLISRKDSPDSMLYHETSNCLLYTFNDNILLDLKNNTKIYLQQCRNKKINEDSINDENLKDFLQHLQFYFNYPSGQGMENITENQLSVMRDICNFYNETSSRDIHSKMMDWFQQKDGAYLTEIHANAMFFEIKRDKYWQKLQRYNVFFQNNLKFDSPTKVFHIVDDKGLLLREIQVYRTLRDIKNVLCVRPESDAEELKETLKSFELPKYTFITIICSNTMEESLIQEVTSKLEQILSHKDYKKVILVTGNNNELTTQVRLRKISHEVIHGSVIFDDLSEETKKKLLEKRIINFQGNIFSLDELFATESTEDCRATLNSEILEKLIRTEEVTVGSRVHPLDIHIESLYINRTFIRDDEEIEEANIFELNEKVILLTDGPGMGKSTVLTNLAITIKKKYPHLWVIKIVLNDYTRILKTFLSENKITLNISELLNSQFETQLKHQLEQFLFAKNNRVVLMLDGFDEVSPSYTELMENLIVRCQQAQNLAKIIVTSRSNVTEQLERKLNVKAFNLQPFTEQNQVDFLTNYWTRNLELKETNKAQCKQYAEALLSQMCFSKEMGENDFASIPLQLRVLAEIFQEHTRSENFLNWEGCKEYLETEEMVPNLPQINFAKIFKMFVDKKRGVYLEKLNPSGNAMVDLSIKKQFEECLEYYRTQALEVIFDRSECKLFTDYKKNNNSVENEVCNIGIMQETDNGIDFIHRTFAEYFVAECLVRELQCQNQNLKFQKFLIDEILRKLYYNVIRAFLDSFLQEILDSLPSNIFKKYQCFTFEVNKHEVYLLHDLAGHGHVANLQLILKSIDFEVIKPTNFMEFTPFPKRRKGTIFGKIKDFYKIMRYRNRLNILRFCVRQGGVNIRDDSGHTPLDIAVYEGHLDMVKFLVEQGSCVNCNRPPHQAFDMALYRAVERDHFEIVKFLVELWAKIKSNGKWNHEIWHEAVVGNHLNIEKYLLEKIMEMDESAAKNSSVPYTAAHLGRLDILELLFAKGAAANDRIPNGETLLFGAARGGRQEIIRFLVDHGANVNRTDDEGNTALHIISDSSSLNLTAKLLIDLGIDINVVADENGTALHIAIEKGNLDTAQLLIEYCAKVNIAITNNIKRMYLCTPLHYAATYDHLKIVKLLVQNGAHIDKRDGKGFSALDRAADRGHLDIVKYLVEVRNNVGVNFEDHNGCRALRVAIEKGKLHVVKFLLEFGVDVNIKNNEYPLLHSAVKSREFEIVKLLTKYCTDLNVTDENGNTALHVATKGPYIKMNIVKLLVNSGVNVNAKNKDDRTALHLILKLCDDWPNCLRLVKQLDLGTFDKGLEEMSEADMLKRWRTNCYNMKDYEKDVYLPECATYLSVVIFLVKHGTDINLKDSHGNTTASLIKEKGGEGGQLLMKRLDLELYR